MDTRTLRSPARQRGSAISLLLGLLVIGLLAYFALRSTSAPKKEGLGQSQMVSCEKVMSDLIQRTGGIGPEYKAGYDAAPPACKGLLPPPAALDPSARQQGDQ
jgi:hypothetical protein